MTAVISVTESLILTGIRSWILSLITCEVASGLANRVAMPKGPCIIFTPLDKTRYSTNVNTYDHTTKKFVEAHFLQAVQLDCYGPASSDWAAILATMWRGDDAVTFLTGSGITPLWADDPVQVPFVSGEQQYEVHWTLKIHLQYSPVISTTQDFSDSATVQITDAERAYNP